MAIYLCKDLTRARHSALHTSGLAGRDAATITSVESHLGQKADQTFSDIPADMLRSESWKVVCSQKWQFQENILRTEARALLWSLEHKLRRASAPTPLPCGQPPVVPCLW